MILGQIRTILDHILKINIFCTFFFANVAM